MNNLEEDIEIYKEKYEKYNTYANDMYNRLINDEKKNGDGYSQVAELRKLTNQFYNILKELEQKLELEQEMKKEYKFEKQRNDRNDRYGKYRKNYFF